tara:strand:- start:710 stop:925 length:216 start_codon:yes stop_codon:yes gene_type:complete
MTKPSKNIPIAPQPETTRGLVFLEHEIRAIETHNLAILNIMNKARQRALEVMVDMAPAPTEPQTNGANGKA